jgi:hypothetical protein
VIERFFDYLERKILHPPVVGTIEEWSAWHAAQERDHPGLLLWLIWDLPYYLGAPRRRLRAAIRWVRYRTTRRYHVIKIRGLSPGYCDADTRMLYGCFSLLMDFVEKEIGGLAKLREWTSELLADEGYNHAAQIAFQEECEVLYLWWAVERPRRIDPIDLWNEDERQHQEDEDMLIRLIRIRRGMWT